MIKRSVMLHSVTMARRNFRAYAMLSVTIILSFALLLGYFAYSDSTLYNTYKKVFSLDRQLVSIWEESMPSGRYDALMEQTAKIPETHSYSVFTANDVEFVFANLKDQQGTPAYIPIAEVICIPSQIWGLHDVEWESYEITWLDHQARDGIELTSGEAILDAYTFRLLGLDQMEDPVYTFQVSSFNSRSPVSVTVRIVGTFLQSEEFAIQVNSEGQGAVEARYSPQCIFSLMDLNPQVAPELNWTRRVVFHTQDPERLYEVTENMKFNGNAVYVHQNSALAAMRQQKQIKAVIAAALLLLLGFNLYSSFNNALSERKFEIGVKRALGASKWSIVRQFLYESILVMLIDILLSVALVVDAALIYKLVYESIPDKFGIYHEFILYLSPYSAAMFLICSVSLSVVFSIIFAYKSTQIQIVDYLKAE